MPNKHKKYNYPEAIVGALIINNNDKLIFCKSHKWKGKYTIFGGHIEYGESIENAVIREVKEETGLETQIIANIGISDSIFNSGFHEKKHFVFVDFLCKYDGGEDDITINEEYEDDYKWVTADEAQKMDLADGAKLMLSEYIKYKESQNYLDGWKRCQADFENYKKMQIESQREFVKYAGQNIVMQIIPVLDNFHMSTDHIPEDQKDGGWVVGIMHIQKQLENVLAENGVEEISAKEGDKFDPAIHEAIQSSDKKQETKDKEEAHEPRTNNQELVKKIVMKGYKMGDKIIRPVKVIV